MSKIYFPIQKKIIREGFWVLLGELISAIGIIAGIRLLTEYLSPPVFGEVSLLMGIIGLLYGLFCQPLLMANIRFYPDMSFKNQLFLLRTYLIKLLVGVTGIMILIILFAGGLYRIFNDISLLTIISLMGLAGISVMKGMEVSFLSAARRQRTLAIINTAETWGRPFCAIMLVILIGERIDIVLLGYFFATVIVMIIFYLIEKREGTVLSIVSIDGEEKRKLFNDIKKYALPLMPLAIVGWISGVGDRYIIGGMLGFAKVGIYAAVYGLIRAPFLISGGIIEQTLRPIYFNAISLSDREKENRIFKTWILMTVIVCVIGVVGVWGLKEFLAKILLAEKYRSGVVLMPWIALGHALLIMSNVFEKPLYGYGKTMAVTYVQGAGGIMSIIIGVPFIYFFGIKGAAYAIPIYYFIQFGVALYNAGFNGRDK